jgi:thioredoxin-like negative regulator of GroEL
MLPLALLLASTVGADPYADAYHAAQRDRLPLLVVLGAEWCSGCRTLKNVTLPRLRQRRALERVHLATVDTDTEEELAGQLLAGDTIPQVVLYRWRNGVWERKQLIGTQTEEAVQKLLQE